jgi:hypothetical protein
MWNISTFSNEAYQSSHHYEELFLDEKLLVKTAEELAKNKFFSTAVCGNYFPSKELSSSPPAHLIYQLIKRQLYQHSQLVFTGAPSFANKFHQKVSVIREVAHKQFQDINQEAYTLYMRSFESVLNCKILGDESLRNFNQPLFYNFGILSTDIQTRVSDKMSRFFGTLNQAQDPQHELAMNVKGSILCSTKWNVFMNDAAMLGAIHSRQVVYLVFKNLWDIPDDFLYDAPNMRPRVLGRELLGLYACGYKVVDQDTPDLGLVLVPPACQDNLEGNFDKMVQATRKIASADQIRNILSAHSLSYNEICMGALANY